MLARPRPEPLDLDSAPARRRASLPGTAARGEVLRLQRTIGNRATTRLILRQPAPETEAEAAEWVERQRGRYETERQRQDARRQHPEPPPHHLVDEKVKTADKVDSKTPGRIQAALAESRILRPYLGGRFPAQRINDGKFDIEGREARFNRDFARSRGPVSDTVTDADLAAQYGQHGGYFDRPTNTIHVRSRSTFGQAMHEAMHKISNPGFKWWGKMLDEGVTQYFADRVLVEQRLAKDTSHSYQAELACAENLVLATDEDLVARAYFLGEPALRETLMRRFNLGVEPLSREAGSGRLCGRLP